MLKKEKTAEIRMSNGMNKKLKKILAFTLPMLFLVPFLISMAEPTSPTPSVGLKNPLAGGDTLAGLLAKLMDIVASIGGVAVVFFIIYAGFQFVMAQGNPGKLEKAKETLMYTLIGATVLLGADVIAHVVVGTVDTIKKP